MSADNASTLTFDDYSTFMVEEEPTSTSTTSANKKRKTSDINDDPGLEEMGQDGQDPAILLSFDDQDFDSFASALNLSSFDDLTPPAQCATHLKKYVERPEEIVKISEFFTFCKEKNIHINTIRGVLTRYDAPRITLQDAQDAFAYDGDLPDITKRKKSQYLLPFVCLARTNLVQLLRKIDSSVKSINFADNYVTIECGEMSTTITYDVTSPYNKDPVVANESTVFRKVFLKMPHPWIVFFHSCLGLYPEVFSDNRGKIPRNPKLPFRFTDLENLGLNLDPLLPHYSTPALVISQAFSEVVNSEEVVKMMLRNTIADVGAYGPFYFVMRLFEIAEKQPQSFESFMPKFTRRILLKVSSMVGTTSLLASDPQQMLKHAHGNVDSKILGALRIQLQEIQSMFTSQINNQHLVHFVHLFLAVNMVSLQFKKNMEDAQFLKNGMLDSNSFLKKQFTTKSGGKRKDFNDVALQINQSVTRHRKILKPQDNETSLKEYLLSDQYTAKLRGVMDLEDFLETSSPDPDSKNAGMIIFMHSSLRALATKNYDSKVVKVFYFNEKPDPANGVYSKVDSDVVLKYRQFAKTFEKVTVVVMAHGLKWGVQNNVFEMINTANVVDLYYRHVPGSIHADETHFIFKTDSDQFPSSDTVDTQVIGRGVFLFKKISPFVIDGGDIAEALKEKNKRTSQKFYFNVLNDLIQSVSSLVLYYCSPHNAIPLNDENLQRKILHQFNKQSSDEKLILTQDFLTEKLDLFFKEGDTQ